MFVKSYLVVLVVVSTFLTVSCGKSVTSPGALDVKTGSIIVGDVNWSESVDFDSSHPFSESAKAVADVQFSNGGRCTGFFISDSVLMTNHHCVKSAADVVGMKVYMKHEKGVAKRDWKEVSCTQFIGNDRTLDYALVSCSGTPGQVYGQVELDASEVVEGDDIYVVHQNCDYYTNRSCDWSKKVSQGRVVEVAVDVLYDADTLGGSSGSPVFNADSNKVVAIHHAGYGGNWSGRGEKNGGVAMSKIVPHIMANFPSVFAQGPSGDDDQQDDTPKKDNSSFATATQMGSSFQENVEIESASDVDTYKVSMKAREIFDFKIYFSHAEGDLDFQVFKKVGSRIVKVKSKESASNNESIRMRVSSSTTYYVKVYGYNGATAKYKVKFSK